MTDRITGYAIVANRGAIVTDQPDKHVLMVLSVLGCTKKVAQQFGSKNWTQRLITGRAVMDEFLNLSIEKDIAIDLGKEYGSHYRDLSLNQLVTSPIWRV